MSRKVAKTEDQSVHPEASDARFKAVLPNGWDWRAPTRGEHYRTCSYCGSIHPDDLVEEASWAAQWADMKYGWPHKFYVDVANREPNMLYCLGSTNSPEPHTQWGDTFNAWVMVDQLNAEQHAAVERDGWSLDNTTQVLIGTKAHHHAKFYTIHLKDPAISTETKAAIARISGVDITFHDNGNVRWKPFLEVSDQTVLDINAGLSPVEES